MQHTINNKKYLNLSLYFFLGLSLTSLIWFLFTSENEILGEVTFLTILALIFLAFLNKMKVDVNIKIFSFVLFLFKIIFLAIYSTGNDIIVFPDSYNYILDLDRLIATGDYSLANIQSISGTLHVGHYYSMLIPYLILSTPESILFFNTLIVSMAILLLYKVFEIEFGKKIALFTLVFSSLSLNLILFGSFILKDSIVVFLSALIIYFVRVKQRPYIAILLSLALFTVRIYAGFAFLLAILFEMIFIKINKKGRFFKFLSAAGVVVFIVTILAVPAVAVYFDKSLIYAKEMLGFGIIPTMIITLSKFFFAPLPWNVILNYDTYSILLFDSLIFFMLSFSLITFLIKFLKYKELRSKMWLFIIPILVHAVVLGYEYQGESTRQRIGIFIFLIFIMAVGLFYKHKEKADD